MEVIHVCVVVWSAAKWCVSRDSGSSEKHKCCVLYDNFVSLAMMTEVGFSFGS